MFSELNQFFLLIYDCCRLLYLNYTGSLTLALEHIKVSRLFLSIKSILEVEFLFMLFLDYEIYKHYWIKCGWKKQAQMLQ